MNENVNERPLVINLLRGEGTKKAGMGAGSLMLVVLPPECQGLLFYSNK
jgi:hypothetical protein